MSSKPLTKVPEPTLPRSPPRAVECDSCGIERVKSNRESAEYRAFRKCFADLAGASGILDPGWLADQLYSKELIGRDLRRGSHNQAVEGREKIERLLSAVEDQIVASPTTKFREFLDVLKNEPSLQHLATRLKNTHSELEGTSQHMGLLATLQKQVGSFNYKVVTLVADKLRDSSYEKFAFDNRDELQKATQGAATQLILQPQYTENPHNICDSFT